MLNPTEFAIITVKEAREAIAGIKKLLDPKGKYLNWDKSPGTSPDFYKKIEEAGLTSFYTSLDNLVDDNQTWSLVKNRDYCDH